MLSKFEFQALKPMSFHFYLYRAPDGLGPLNHWDRMQAFPLGTADQVKEQVSALYPNISWRRSQAFWFGLGANGLADPYLDVLLAEEEPGQCFFVVLNKAPPTVMRRIMEALGLNYVCAPESGDLVDPYAYGDHDLHFARKK